MVVAATPRKNEMAAVQEQPTKAARRKESRPEGGRSGHAGSLLDIKVRRPGAAAESGSARPQSSARPQPTQQITPEPQPRPETKIDPQPEAHASPAPAAEPVPVRQPEPEPQPPPESEAHPQPEAEARSQPGLPDRTPLESESESGSGSAAGMEPSPPEDIFAYWDTIRGERTYPSPSDLDETKIANNWPYAMLMRWAGKRAMPELGKLYAGKKTGSRSGVGQNPLTIDDSSMVSAWVLDLSYRALRKGQPFGRQVTFPFKSGARNFMGIALPLCESKGSADKVSVDHVLCYLKPLD
ncbi:MAG: hypothetical protein ACREGL_10715 [Alphaproteobacteria bacterium]